MCIGGSACSTGSGMPSHVLKSIGLPDELSFATVRFTINEEITRQEIDYVVNCLKNDIAQIAGTVRGLPELFVKIF